MSDIEVRPDFVTPEEEQLIYELIAPTIDKKNKSRQSIQYGSFHPCSDGIVHNNYMPPILKTLQQRLVDTGILDELPESVSVNIYPPRAFIIPHVDNITTCGPVIPVIGLMADCPVVFRSVKNGKIDETSTGKQETHTSLRRSVLIMKGDKRYKWTHQTKPIDEFRISLAFRTRSANSTKSCVDQGRSEGTKCNK